jgi:hypothetical protein
LTSFSSPSKQATISCSLLPCFIRPIM